MISKKQPSPATQNDNYARLANYIADASHKGEKCLFAWSAGCLSGDDFQLGISEVLATQACNERTKKAKTYHLVVSFHPEDAQRLQEQDFEKIEKKFADVLGFAEHQRHCGVHINTNNPHMHVAYNMIHPETKNRHEPYRDYWKRDDLCRQLEKDYGVTVDPGRANRREFMRYLSDQKDTFLPVVKAARSWEDIHAAMTESGLQISCNDDVQITPLDGGRGCRIAGEELHTSLDKVALTKRLGEFQKKQKVYLAKNQFFLEPSAGTNDKADAMEVITGEESFVGYLKRYKDVIDNARQSSESWTEFQMTLQVELNVTVKQRGRGAVFADLTKIKGKKGTHYAKMSDLGREYSKQKLEAEFGQVQPLPYGSFKKPKRMYDRDPLHRHPERGKLHKEYKAGIEKRKALFEEQKERREKEMNELRLRWKIKIKQYRTNNTLGWKEKRYLTSAAKAEQLREEEQLRSRYAEQRKAIKQEITYGNWNEFLRQKAEAGNSVALAVLQSSKQKRYVSFKERPVEKLLEGMTYSVDNEGNITYMLKGGGKVVDYGKDIVASDDVEALKFVERMRLKRFIRNKTQERLLN